LETEHSGHFQKVIAYIFVHAINAKLVKKQMKITAKLFDAAHFQVKAHCFRMKSWWSIPFK